MGRPRVEDQNKRIIQVNIRLTEDEYKTVTQYSQASGLSGENDITTGITPRRNGRLRSALIESAWVAIRNDPALLSSYQSLTKRMPGNKAIVRIAKKLLRRMVQVLRIKKSYEKGVIK